jgi:long-chain acyl-CoA synthetase
MLIGDIAQRQLARNPNEVAIVDGDSQRALTYAELSRRVLSLATSFVHLGKLVKGDRVAVLSLNRLESVEAYLAAGRAGLVATGLNWRLATDELVRIVEDSRPGVLVCDADLVETALKICRRSDVRLLLSFGAASDGSYEDFIAKGEGLILDVERSYNDPVLILYTGGTTGASKGVVHTNGSLLAAMFNNSVAERIVSTDRYLLLGQMFHSASVLALNYLMHGARLVLLPRFEPRQALEVIESEQVTATCVFPAMINYMVAEADCTRFDLGSLRNVQYGGGPFAPRMIRQMSELLPCDLLQCYGSTEHIGVTFLSPQDHREAAAGRYEDRLLSCGREAHLSAVRIVDEDGALVPRDRKTPGEIFVDSPANMVGYWNRPDLTNAARGEHGDLGTGDLAVWDNEGYVYIVDRAKDMIISGGENIYAAQLEKAIGDHQGVLEVAVVGAPDEVWGEAAVAFVVANRGAVVTGDDIRAAVTHRLGSYQKPRDVHFVTELPKAATGKVAKQELRRLARDLSGGKSSALADQTHTETKGDP